MAILEKVRRSVVIFTQEKYSKITNYAFSECDPTALSLFRILFGFLMVLDIPQERGLEDADLRFGDPNYCFFPLFPFIPTLKLSHACILYSIMWVGSLGIMLGFRFRCSCFLYFVPYLYFFLLDKSRWNNHSYLFGLTVILISGSDAGNYLSVDSNLSPKKTTQARKWNYFMLKFQLFILYFYAAVKKCDVDWIHGYSMQKLAQHWVFDPIKLVIREDIIEYYMIHLGGLFYDLSVGFMLNIQFTKKLAFLLSFAFHGLNSQIFTIGMFPYVCLASLVLFCEPHEFPCNLFKPSAIESSKMNTDASTSSQAEDKSKVNKRIAVKAHAETLRTQTATLTTSNNNNGQWWKVLLMFVYIFIQLVLPFTHSITKGYNNWTQGLYGYSWDMMVYSWNTLHIKVTVVDQNTGNERYLDPDVWVTNDRWSSHADMAKQYSECIARNLANSNVTNNITVYLDVWKSLNGRFQQRVFDPRVNILEAPWSPWESVTWVLPLLKQYSDSRKGQLDLIASEVANWTASSNVIFVADYPGMYLENYMPPELANVTVAIMRGEIAVEQESKVNRKKYNTTLTDTIPGQNVHIRTDDFHRIYTMSPTPSCYMYTYTNATIDRMEASIAANTTKVLPPEPGETLVDQFQAFVEDKTEMFSRSFYLIFNSYLNVFFDIPMVIRRLV